MAKGRPDPGLIATGLNFGAGVLHRRAGGSDEAADHSVRRGGPVGGIVLAAGLAVFWNCPRSPRTGPCASYPSIFGVSLEGNAEPTLAPRSKLRSQADLLLRLKKPGRDPLLLIGLISLFQRLRPYGVHTHHITEVPLLRQPPCRPVSKKNMMRGICRMRGGVASCDLRPP